MPNSAEIKKLQPIGDWKNKERQARYYKGAETLSPNIYTRYKNSERNPKLGSLEDVSCFALIEVNGKFSIYSKKGNSQAEIIQIGKDKEKAILAIIRKILLETHAHTFCLPEKFIELTSALRKALDDDINKNIVSEILTDAKPA